jgi:hypothetical protein
MYTIWHDISYIHCESLKYFCTLYMDFLIYIFYIRCYNSSLKHQRCQSIITELNQLILLKKEVIHPQLPLRMPCYDLNPVTNLAFSPRNLRVWGALNFQALTGSVYKTRERIHRGEADPRLLAIPASRSRVADFDPY